MGALMVLQKVLKGAVDLGLLMVSYLVDMLDCKKV